MRRKRSKHGGHEVVTDGPERHYAIWVSDDDARVPLVMQGKTTLGDVTLELVEYAGESAASSLPGGDQVEDRAAPALGILEHGEVAEVVE